MDPHLAWFVLFNPLASSALIHLLLRKSAGTAAFVSVASSVVGLIAAVGIWSSGSPARPIELPWLDFGEALRVPIGLLIDDLSKVMLLIVTGIGALIHIYSLVYMGRDEGKARYFGNLSLFMFSMLGIVLANNFGMMFIFWELVGVSSYLLIGHWFTRAAAAAAANKAFITNRIGDFGFMLGILMIWGAAGTIGFDELRVLLKGGIGVSVATYAANMAPVTPGYWNAAVLLIFCGAVGKSAQMPLHVWLPDAMEGPTPVSALIHAATMVAAGVYMLARVFFLFNDATLGAQTVIAWVGILTATFAALMATQQDDIKRILAYSTLSQLGYMICAIGLAAPGPAMFHLFTHAFFKALLFLGAGAIIHALHHEQNIWKMGGLRGKMKLTFLTFTAGYLALIGFPFLSGFFSKDAILLAAYERNGAIFFLGLATAFLTAYYMTRLFVVVFLGVPRSEAAEHGHDRPPAMTGPLVILALLSVFSAYGTEHFFEQAVHSKWPAHSLAVPILATIVFLAGSAGAYLLYAGQKKDPVLIPAFKNKFYIDEIYAALIAGTQDLLAAGSAFFDKWVINGFLVRGLSGGVWACGFALRCFQYGNLQGYAFLFGAGVVALIFFMILAKP